MDRISGGEPAMHFEAPPTPEVTGENQENKAERDQPAHQETAASKAPPAPSQATPQISFPTDTAVPQVAASQQATQPPGAKPVITGPLHAADGNNIEKEWVDALKLVEARTKNDPYIQKEEVSRIKADYQLKRFNKKPNADEALPV
jgi:hypothetical protein